MTDYPGLAVLVTDARSGSRIALERLLYDLGDALLPLASAIARDQREADQLLSDTLSRVYERLGQLRSDQAVVPWARRILVRLCADEHRFWRRAATIQLTTEPHAEQSLEPEVRVDLRHAVETLPRKDRTLLALHYWLGLSIAECAVELGVPPGTAKSRLNAALKKLRARIGNE